MEFKKEDAKRVIVKKSKSGSTYKTFIFDCVECEKEEISLSSYSLKNSSGKCRKCCQRKRPYEHILNELIHICKTKTKHFINLTYKEFISIINKGNCNCHYCNKPLQFSPYTRDENSNYTSRAYQLDRKDNSKGYTKENVVPCCWDCNRIKSDIYTYEEFLIIAESLKIVYKNRINKCNTHT